MPKKFILHTSGPSEAPKRLELTEEELTQEHKDFFFGNLLKTFDDCPDDIKKKFLEHVLKTWQVKQINKTVQEIIGDYDLTGETEIIPGELEYFLNKDWADRVANMKEIIEKSCIDPDKNYGQSIVERGDDVRKKLDDEILFTHTDDLGMIPLYARILPRGRNDDGICIRYRKDRKDYYRDAGDWSVRICVIPGISDTAFLSVSENEAFHMLKMIPISKNEWKESNKGYIPEFLDDERKPRPY